MNTYTLDPPQPELPAASAPAPATAPVYIPPAYQYPKLESASAPPPAPMVAPVYMPPTYQYPRPEYAATAAPAPTVAPVYMHPTYLYPKPESASAPAPASMVAPFYMPPTDQNQSYQNPPTVNVQSDMSKIRDWLPWSIASLFLTVPLGILPLVFSLVCRSKKRKNDINGARTMSTLALVFNIISAITGVLAILGFFVYFIVLTQRMGNTDS